MIKHILTVLLLFVLLVSCNKDSESSNTSSGGSEPATGQSLNGTATDDAGLDNSEWVGDDLKLNGAVARSILLDNNLRVTLLHSETSFKSAISIGVNVGHMDNPIDAQGQAHYLEHMLFLGTKEFPVVDEYSKFVIQNSGTFNANTTMDHTKYFLDVQSTAFDEAVHRISRFFVSPLFDPVYTDREKNAVENEFKLGFELRIPFRAYRSFYRDDSKQRLFLVGNLKTLENIKDTDNKAFFNEHYYAEAMHAVLAGPQSLDELQSIATKYLSDIKSNPTRIPNNHIEKNVFDLEKLPARVLARPVTGRASKLQIVIPYNKDQTNDNVLRALTLLVGDKSETSLMKALVDQGWINANLGNYGAFFSRDSVYIAISNLTEKGRNEKDKIESYIYSYLQFLRSSDLPAYLSKEVFALNESQKYFTSYYNTDVKVVSGLSNVYFSAIREPKNTEELFFNFKPQAFSDNEYFEVLAAVNWDKRFIIDTDIDNPIVDKTYDEIENIEFGGVKIVESEDGKKIIEDSIYKFSFAVTDLDDVSVTPGLKFTFKEQNSYAPSDFEVYNEDVSEKYKKTSGSWGEFYLSDLGESGVAYSYLDLDLFSHGIDFNSKTDVTSFFLMREILKRQMIFKAYPFVQMGFSYDFPIFIFNGHLTLKFNGWSDKYLSSLKDFLEFSNLVPDEDSLFEEVKKSYAQVIQTEQESDLSAFATRAVFSGASNSYLNYDEILGELENLNFDTYQNFTKRYSEGLFVRGVLSGDVNETYPSAIVDLLKSTWGLKDNLNMSPDYSASKLAEDVILKDEALNINEQGPSDQRSVSYAFRNMGEIKSEKEKLILNIINPWLGRDYYTELRTNQALAYSLFAVWSPFFDYSVLRTNLVSSSNTAADTSQRIDEFLTKWATDILPTKSEDLFNSTRQSLVLRDLNFPIAPEEAHKKYVELSQNSFQSLEAFRDYVGLYNEISLQEVIDYAQKRLLKQPTGVLLQVEAKN